MEDFEKALNFALSSGNDERIGIIGGEPTLHSHFKELMIRLIDDKRVCAVTVFTNGTNIEGFSDELCNPKVALLINCNTPQNMGNKTYEKMKSNIDFLINNKHMNDRITLGKICTNPILIIHISLNCYRNITFQRLEHPFPFPTKRNT